MRCGKKGCMIILAVLLISCVSVLNTTSNAGEIPSDPYDRDDFVRMENIYGDLAPGEEVYVGQQNVTFMIEVRSLRYSDGTGDNVTNVNVNLGGDSSIPVGWTRSVDVPGENGADMSWLENETYMFGTFEFDVLPDADPGDYNISVDINYDYVDENNNNQSATLNTWILFEILGNTDVHDGGNVWAGKDFQQLSFDVDPVSGTVPLRDTHLKLDTNTLYEGLSLEDDTAYIPGTLDDNHEANFRLDVSKNVPPREYQVDYTLTTHRLGVEITETGLVNFVVDYTPRLDAKFVEPLEISQGTREKTFQVQFTNTGNVDLNEVRVGLREESPYFVKAVEHYEYTEPETPSTVELGGIQQGHTSLVNFTLGFHKNLQSGEHKLEFYWDGWYYKTGDTGESSEYVHVGVDWIDEDPDKGRLYEDLNDNHQFDNGEELMTPWDGASTMMTVTSQAIDMEASVGSLGLDRDVAFTQVSVTLQNNELVGYKDLQVELKVGPDTPFLNPFSPDKTRVKMDRTKSDTYIGPKGSYNDRATLVFNVDINREYINGTLSEGAHATYGDIVITSMVNQDTNEKVTDQTITFQSELQGFGPRLVVDGVVSDEKIEASETFTLNYTIKNQGDDIARDTWVTLRPEKYSNEDWRIIGGLIKKATTGGEYTYSKRARQTTNGSGTEDSSSVPVSAALTMDYSGSMSSDDISNMETGAKQFVDELGNDDQAEIIKFGTDVQVAQTFTRDKGELKDAIDMNASVGGGTSFYDSLYTGLQDAKDQSGAKAVIGLTDGKDGGSNKTLDETISYANQLNIPVYTIGLGDVDNTTLGKIASNTGGEYYYAATYSDIQDIYGELSETVTEELDDGSYDTEIDKESYTKEPVSLMELDIDSAKEIIDLNSYIEESLSSPPPKIWTVYIGELSPGENVTVSFEMMSSKNMQVGKPYQEDIVIQYKDSYSGKTRTKTRQVTIRTDRSGETYTAEESRSSSGGVGQINGIMIIIALVAILLVVWAFAYRERTDRRPKDTSESEVGKEELEGKPKLKKAGSPEDTESGSDKSPDKDEPEDSWNPDEIDGSEDMKETDTDEPADEDGTIEERSEEDMNVKVKGIKDDPLEDTELDED